MSLALTLVLVLAVLCLCGAGWGYPTYVRWSYIPLAVLALAFLVLFLRGVL